jgi:uroporphyrinogen III methyltransferase/synthase
VRVVVTRAEHQAAGLAAALVRLGATVDTLPLLAVLPPADPAPLAAAAARLAGNDWVVFTSANAVDAFAPHAPAAWPAAVRVAAVGPATAAALARRGVEPSLVAGRTQAEGVLAELLPLLGDGARVLLPQAADARTVLAAGLRGAGVDVDVVVAYRKALPPDAPARAAALFGDGPLGWVTFTSPSVARGFAGLFGDAWPARRQTLCAASIGPVTSEALRACGVVPAAEAATSADDELAAAIAASHAGSG